MTRLILTTSDSGAGGLRQTGLADCVFGFGMRFVWGRGAPENELDAWLAPRLADHDASSHWLDGDSWWLKDARAEEGLIEFCERFDTIELWPDPDPNSQLTLIWLLDYLRRHARTSLNLNLVQADHRIGDHMPEEVTEWRLPPVKIQNEHFDAASNAWQAYREPTPEGWFKLLSEEISLLPQLRQSALELLEELPGDTPGLALRKC